jgi:hypothetical protein
MMMLLQVDVLPASESNPGIPPSSLMSFLRVKPSIQGLVLAEFNEGFINPYFGSRFDNGSTINADGMASVAAVLAAAVHRLAGGDPAALKVGVDQARIERGVGVCSHANAQYHYRASAYLQSHM